MHAHTHDVPADRSTEVALLAALGVGAAGSLAFTLYAGLRIGAPGVLLVLFAGWVVFPFVVLAGSYWLARRRSDLVRLALFRSSLLVSFGSLMLYGVAAFGPARPKTPVFVLVAPMSLLVAGVLVAAAVFAVRQRR
jgi:hypothetical protein